VLLLRLLLLSRTPHFWLEAAADLEPPYKKKFQSPRARKPGHVGFLFLPVIFGKRVSGFVDTTLSQKRKAGNG
jgi:hypothetical protein